MDVAGTDLEDRQINRLTAVGQCDGSERFTLFEGKRTADVDKFADRDRHVSGGSQERQVIVQHDEVVGIGAGGDSQSGLGTGAVIVKVTRIEIDRRVCVVRVGQGGVVATIDVDLHVICGNRESFDADQFDVPCRLQGVEAAQLGLHGSSAVFGGRGDLLFEQCQGEINVAEGNSHRTVGGRRVILVDAIVGSPIRTRIVLEVGPTDTDKRIDVAGTYGQSRNGTNLLAVGQRQALEGAALFEGEVARDMDEFIDGKSDKTRRLEESLVEVQWNGC